MTWVVKRIKKLLKLMEEITCQEFTARQYKRLKEKDEFIPLEDV